MDKTFYITTPIYFPNDKLHIGHSYTTVAADTLSRYKKLRGFDVKFLTGTDEHGQKIERIAKANNQSPKEYVDEIVKGIKELWALMDIQYDIYIRTTDKDHEQAVQKIFKKLYDKGDIYKSEYEGLYCTPCESFFTERQLKDGKCPDCNREVEKVLEESYFFRLSKYQDAIMKHLDDNPEFVLPLSRKNEMVNNFLKPGLEDLCVSRTSFKWGIPVDFDPSHVVYVWIDALSNYITALGYGSENTQDYEKYWPADVHFMAKEIVRFHAIVWAAMLMALEEPLPKQIFGHGWIVIDGGKMSKSKGSVVDPKVLVEKYDLDAIRYFIMREFAFGQDGNYTTEALIQRINSDLANDLGNLLSRTVGMIDKYFGGVLPVEQAPTTFDQEIIDMAIETVKKVETAMDVYAFNDALGEIWSLIGRLNKYTDETQPWFLVKDESKKSELANVLYVLAESLRIISILISPFMPKTPLRIHEQLNIKDSDVLSWDSSKTFGLLKKDVSITKGDVVFPRLDMKKILEQEVGDMEEKACENEKQAPKPTPNQTEKKPEISIDDFDKVELKTALVLECEKIEGSKKLLKFKVKIGEETRQILSGISKHYDPEKLVGKTVVVVTNLKPAKLMGNISEGMILSACDDDDNLSIITTAEEAVDGAEVR